MQPQRIDPFTGEPIVYHYFKNGKSPRKTAGLTEDAITQSKKRRRALLRKYRPMIMSLLFVMLTGILLRRGNAGAGFTYAEHLKDIAVVMTAPDDVEMQLDLQDLAYYVLRIEQDGNERATAYDPEDPKAYWSLFLNDEGEQSGYMSDLGRRAVVDYAVRDAIYAREAQKAGFALTEVQERTAVLAADQMFLHLTQKAQESMGLSRELLIDSVKKETLAREYMLYLYGLGERDLDVGGASYEALKASYAVREQTDIIQGIRIGFVSIN
ncbi:MAG: hypothetical protein IJ600_10175 [Lachnospiraceae bacterium]|nr:hypothetical protein [Lachnospiraceae bacterium]